jgi:hypothetical protein
MSLVIHAGPTKFEAGPDGNALKIKVDDKETVFLERGHDGKLRVKLGQQP